MIKDDLFWCPLRHLVPHAQRMYVTAALVTGVARSETPTENHQTVQFLSALRSSIFQLLVLHNFTVFLQSPPFLFRKHLVLD